MTTLPLLTWPNDLLLSLEQGHKGWRAYVKQRQSDGAGDLRGDLDVDPQVAINKAVAALRKAQTMPRPKPTGLALTLDLSLLERK